MARVCGIGVRYPLYYGVFVQLWTHLNARGRDNYATNKWDADSAGFEN